MQEKQFKVRAAHCDYRATEEEIYQTLRRITDPLTHAWKPIETAKKVVMKLNMMKPAERIIYFEGRRRELVDDAVCRAVLRLIKEHTTAQLVATDTNPYTHGHRMPPGFNYEHHLKEFDVQFVDSNLPPFKVYDVPGGGSMFDRYTLSACFDDADAVVSVAKMKNHAFMGITLCHQETCSGCHRCCSQKAGHAVITIISSDSPMCFPDLALITKPCLNIIDALTGQWGREWGGVGRICNALIAGDHPISTDTVGMHLMGHDPQSDWPTPPLQTRSEPYPHRSTARIRHCQLG